MPRRPARGRQPRLQGVPDGYRTEEAGYQGGRRLVRQGVLRHQRQEEPPCDHAPQGFLGFRLKGTRKSYDLGIGAAFMAAVRKTAEKDKQARANAKKVRRLVRA